MKLLAWIPLILSGLLLITDVALLMKMVRLVNTSKDDTVAHLTGKLNPYLYATTIVSVLLAVCMILVVVLK